MSFDAFLKQAWSDHGEHAAEVAERVQSAHGMVETAANVMALAGLVTHVFGEHLARWQDGESELRRLMSHPACAHSPDAQRAVARSIGTLRLGAGSNDALDDLNESDRAQAYAVAASALSAQGDLLRGAAYYDLAVELGGHGIEPGDPAVRSLAITSNGLAVTLLNKAARDRRETDLMLRAARESRKFWELAGTWLNMERAEWVLAKALLSAGDQAGAAQHAKACLDLSLANQAPPFELFFAHEAVALVRHAQGDDAGFMAARDAALAAYDQLPAGERPYGEREAETLRGLPRPGADRPR